MKLFTILAASSMLATPAIAQDIETDKTVEEVFALGAEQERDPLAPTDEDVEVEEKVLVKKIDQDGNETEEEVEAAQVERMKSDCPGRIFKTRVESTDEEGNTSAQDVTLCSDSDSDDAWIEFLNNAKRQIALNDNIPVDARDQLIADLDAEIKRAVSDSDG